jgi:hypothetical protein
MEGRFTKIQEFPSVVRNRNNEKKSYTKKGHFFPKMYATTLKMNKGDPIFCRITKIDKNEWKIEITGKTKPGQKFFMSEC